MPKNLFMFVKVFHPKVMKVFNALIQQIQIEKKIKHISSFDTKSKQAYNVDRFINIINWSNEFAISHKIDDADKTSSYDTFSFVNDKLIVSAHYMNGDMPISEDEIEKYYFNQLYDCSKD